MAAEIIKGKPIADKIREEITAEVEDLKKKGVNPKLAVLLVGDDPGSVWYAKSKVKIGEKLGIFVDLKTMDADTDQETVLKTIQGWNEDKDVHGILVELPLPKHLSKEAVMESITPKKDVDGVHPVNRGYLLGGQEHLALVPATPQSCITLAERAGINFRGKRVTLVGRGDTVGRPLASLLIKRDATITVCHTKTVDLAAECRRGEIVVAAAG
ncbi:MAG: bifunctional 5,10-methylenetetrahydrofolate dehydrogenase/5,10-methenyltetrahydrofolate cyclohydrolase, partial [Deltaproteobacteria bacterium]|nr:bifunctional 5,10-methylenetetrahydrofolate dehydrogenase/5,10-methenyltetrahydrofolate cyclohydrolase [Deltaproteobacteria bacterium]